MPTWTITAAGHDKRLDVFLTEKMAHTSRSALQKLIRNGQVSVNDKPVTVHHFLKVGDRVNIKIKKTAATKTTKQQTASATRSSNNPPHSLTPFIIDETADWLVINKPAGLLVHPDKSTDRESLVDLLVAHAPTIGRVGENPERPGIVHRLDREVSGLMVIAKTQRAYDDLQRQFAQRNVEKTYLALVHGELTHDEGDIKFRIARSTSKPRMAARPTAETAGKAAWTHYVVRQRFIGASLLDVQILSGRTHQIRAHLHALGHPVMGDSLYALRRTDRHLQVPRLMLQSVGLSFIDPASGKRKSYHIEPDQAFHQLNLRLSSSASSCHSSNDHHPM